MKQQLYAANQAAGHKHCPSVTGISEQDRVYLYNGLTQQQMEGRRTLDTCRLQLKAAGHKTWWRWDVLHRADDDGVHCPGPSQP